MERRHLLKLFALLPIGAAAMKLNELRKMTDALPNGKPMPVVFIGHGSPMNAIEDNEFSRGWRKIAATIPKPTAILCVSAHWETKGTLVTAMERPRTIHDFGGFPKQLFDVQYPAKGSQWLVDETKQTIQSTLVKDDFSWGLDHGTWSVLKHLYPAADVPVMQLSLDVNGDADYHYRLANELKSLRNKGVLILGSGNMVHNFQYLQVQSGGFNQHFGHDWALEANDAFKRLLSSNDVKSLVNYSSYSRALSLSAPTPEHYLPMIYTLGLRNSSDEITYFNDAVVGGSFSMTSFILS